MSQFSPRRFWFFVRHTSPLDRIVLAVLSVCAAARLARALGAALPFATLLDFLALASIIYFVVRLIPLVRAKLLWSLRNRLIVAYIFMAVVPIVLLLTMVGVSLYLLELQIGAHLLRDDIGENITAIGTDTEEIAAAISREPQLKIDAPAPTSPSRGPIQSFLTPMLLTLSRRRRGNGLASSCM